MPHSPIPPSVPVVTRSDDWRFRLRTAAPVISIIVHLIVFLLLLYIWHISSRAGVPWGTRTTDSVGIVFSTPKGYKNPQSGETIARNETQNLEAIESESPGADWTESFLPAPGIGMTADQGASEAQTSESGANNQANNQTVGQGTGQEVGFSDLKGNGRRFVYVLDRSESMKWSNFRPIQYALEEAKKSVRSLDTRKGASKFQLVWFNHRTDSYGDGKLMDVTEPNKERVCRQLASIIPDGGTNVYAAIDRATQMRPDVIFLLTDADEELPGSTLSRIRELVTRYGVRQIHVVEFGKKSESRKNSYRQLATENNGQYIFKDIESL